MTYIDMVYMFFAILQPKHDSANLRQLLNMSQFSTVGRKRQQMLWTIQ
jgi:hypothetical protein